MDGLDLKAANGTDLPYKGWMELTFNLIEDDFDHTVKVPVPIVGFNVIEEIAELFQSSSSAGVDGLLVDVLTSSLTGVERSEVEALVQFIHLSLQRNWLL